jgi:hypothetical protein
MPQILAEWRKITIPALTSDEGKWAVSLRHAITVTTCKMFGLTMSWPSNGLDKTLIPITEMSAGFPRGGNLP